jgi:hypothetical protein
MQALIWREGWRRLVGSVPGSRFEEISASVVAFSRASLPFY